jgi:hypothetical protein
MKTVNFQPLQTSFFIAYAVTLAGFYPYSWQQKIWYIIKHEIANLVQIAAQFESATEGENNYEYVEKPVRSQTYKQLYFPKLSYNHVMHFWCTLFGLNKYEKYMYLWLILIKTNGVSIE